MFEDITLNCQYVDDYRWSSAVAFHTLAEEGRNTAWCPGDRQTRCHSWNMTDETEAAEKPAPSDKPSPDPLLAVFVRSINQFPEYEIGVTLHVNGLIISGVMISMTSYFERLASWLRNAGAEGYAEVFDWLHQETTFPSRDGAPSESDEEMSDPGSTAFIHLRDANAWGPDGAHSLAPVIWRGRLDHVSGWSIGTFSGSPAPGR